jgi:thymidylate synthase ThyX
MSELETLNHTTRSLDNGEKILVLDTGAVIGPESEAMLQALHSRSVGGIKEHLEKLEKRGPEKFMETFYVGYGHKSIGDCGTITIFIENVSMLASKAIQDWPLYSGQESSTRYVDFSVQEFADPAESNETKQILEQWRNYYEEGLEELNSYLKIQHPKKDGESKNKYQKAIDALAFDIMRGFLPAGATTNLAWHSNLRQITDKLLRLRNHPLKEVRRIAKGVEGAVLEAFPSSFSDKSYEKTEGYYEKVMKDKYYFEAGNHPNFAVSRDDIDYDLINDYRSLLDERPEKTELPKFLAEAGQLQFEYLLDFGSFRDIQRHRAVDQRMPLVVTDHGFEEWYLKNLSDDLRAKAEDLLTSQEEAITNLNIPVETKQYYIPMGYKLPNRLTGDLPALVYLTELRARRDVHPTLSHRASQIGKTIKDKLGDILHLEDEPRRFDVRRGGQDIIDKHN